MRILLTASFADSLINFRASLIQALIAKNCEVHVAAPELNTESSQYAHLQAIGAIAHSIPIKRVGINPITDIKSLLCLWRLMQSVQPDIILSYTIKPVIYGTLASWFARVPRRFAMITGLGYAFQEKNNRQLIHSLVCRLYKLVLKKTHKVIFQNPDDENLFRSLNLLPKHIPSCIINGSGVNLTRYPSTPLSAEPHFLFIGRLLGDKGVREYIEAARCILSRNPYAIFHLVGWIDTNPNAIAQHELDSWIQEGTVQFHGHLCDVRPTIANSNIFVLPSYREGTPRSVLEAMSMGRPIITTDAPGCRETVVNSDNGFLVPVKSVTHLVLSLIHI